jgi:hypothetical protein
MEQTQLPQTNNNTQETTQILTQILTQEEPLNNINMNSTIEPQQEPSKTIQIPQISSEHPLTPPQTRQEKTQTIPEEQKQEVKEKQEVKQEVKQEEKHEEKQEEKRKQITNESPPAPPLALPMDLEHESTLKQELLRHAVQQEVDSFMQDPTCMGDTIYLDFIFMQMRSFPLLSSHEKAKEKFEEFILTLPQFLSVSQRAST